MGTKPSGHFTMHTIHRARIEIEGSTLQMNELIQGFYYWR